MHFLTLKKGHFLKKINTKSRSKQKKKKQIWTGKLFPFTNINKTNPDKKFPYLIFERKTRWRKKSLLNFILRLYL